MPYLIVFAALCLLDGTFLSAIGIRNLIRDSWPLLTIFSTLFVGVGPLILAPVLFYNREKVIAEPPRSALSSRTRWGLVLPAALFAFFLVVSLSVTLGERVIPSGERWIHVLGIGVCGPWLAIAVGAIAAPRARLVVARSLAAAAFVALAVFHVRAFLHLGSGSALALHLQYAAVYSGVILGGIAPRVA